MFVFVCLCVCVFACLFVCLYVFLCADPINIDRSLLAQGMSAAPCELVTDMQAAVERAYALAQPGDAVLLSPACASFDMYKGFADRGNDFIRRVQGVCDD